MGWVSSLPLKARETRFLKAMQPVGVVRSVLEGRLVCFFHCFTLLLEAKSTQDSWKLGEESLGAL